MVCYTETKGKNHSLFTIFGFVALGSLSRFPLSLACPYTCLPSPLKTSRRGISGFGWWSEQLVAEAPPFPPYLPSPFPVFTRGMASSAWWSYQLLQGCLLPLFCCGWRHMTNLTARNQTQIFLTRCSDPQISFQLPSSEWLGVRIFSCLGFTQFHSSLSFATGFFLTCSLKMVWEIHMVALPSTSSL